MLRFRLILAWLLLAALPLQGWAAATMLWCGPVQQTAQASAHHHDGHAGHDGHAQHPVDTADTGHIGDGADATNNLTDDGHTCGVCAACCTGVALAQTPRWPFAAIAPRAELAEPPVAILARPSPVPDKPPRV